jgi:AcrR family transcriptional regulator
LIGAPVPKEDSGTRRHVLDVTEMLLATRLSSELRLIEVAREADVVVQTIYYHFGSFGRLIAEAQMSAYLRIIEPSRQYLAIAEVAIAECNEEAYWKAIGDDIERLWSFRGSGDEWRISKLLIDVVSDPHVRLEFRALLDVQFERWINVVEAGQRRGWVNAEMDPSVLVAFGWAATNGQEILSNTTMVRYTARGIRDFWLQVGRVKKMET